jgi:hypothetical protein
MKVNHYDSEEGGKLFNGINEEESRAWMHFYLGLCSFQASSGRKKKKETKIFILSRWKIKSMLMACGDEGFW